MAGIEHFKLGLDIQPDNFLAQKVQETGAVLEDVAVCPVEGVGVEGTHLRQQGAKMLEALVVLVFTA